MLYNFDYKGKTLATHYGDLEVGEDGVIKGLTKAQEQAMGKLQGFRYEEPEVAPKKTASKSSTTKSSTASKSTSKSTPKKTTTRKTTTKKTEE